MAARLRLGILLVLAACTAAGLAQSGPATQPVTTRPSAASGTDERYWLRVKSDRVYLRCGEDRNSAAVMQVDENAVLEGAGSRYGWQRVVPPDGVFYYVAAEYVDQVAPERGIVSVRSGRLRVRVGSLLTELDPARSEVKMLLDRGAPLRILGRQGEWLKIAPPEGLYLYVADEFVERLTPEDAARLRKEAAPGGTHIVAQRPPAAGTQPTSAPDLSGEWGQRLVLVETAIEAEGRKPPLEQSWATLLARLRPIAEQREEPVVARLAQGWIVRLEQRVADQAALQAARPVGEREARDRTQFEREMEQIRRARQTPESRPAFAARGQLLESLALRGTEAGPRYKLQDPLTGRVVAYVELSAEADIPVARFVGEYVGVRGQRKFDESLGADIVRTTEIELVKWEAPASGPARQTP